MKKVIYLYSLTLILCVAANAQNVGINTPTPKTSLDIKGGIRNQPLYLTGTGTAIIIPDNESNINLTGNFSGQFSATINNPEDGQRLIFDNNSNQTGALIGGPDIRSGLNEYIFSDGEWKTVKTNAWDLNGNYNTNPANNFIGTTDNKDVVFKRDNTEKMRIKESGLEMANEILPNGVAGAANQVLMSNGNGTMQWEGLSTLVSSSSASSGFGVWGDCVTNSVIGAYQPIADTVSSGITETFGQSVAVSGNFAIVGSPYDINSGNPYGAAHIYSLTGNKWVLMQKIADGPPWGVRFGYSVSISGNFAVIGVPVYSPTISGNPDPGAVSVYQYNGTSWVFMQRLTDPAGASGDRFGNSVCISGNRIIVGANSDDNGAVMNQGSASIYQYNGSSWVLMQKIIDAAGAADDNFGLSVSIDGNIAIIGAPYDDNSTFLNQGSATIYRFNGSTWFSSLRTTNPSSVAQVNWGKSVSVSGNSVIIGTPNDNIGANLRQGSVSFFDFTGANWLYGGKFSNPNGFPDDSFGDNVFLSGEYAIVGATYGNVGSILNQGTGMIFFRYSGNIWQRLIPLSDPAGAGDDNFGNSVCIDGANKRFLIGAVGFSSFRGKALFGKVN